jgi:uncharacterized protein YfaS (alpha-2-macroglobulin family)
MATYDKGDYIRISAIWRNDASVAVDPSTITLKIFGPSGQITQYTYAEGYVVKDSVGNFHYDFLPTERGNYTYRWEGTGNAIAAGQSSFFIEDRIG